MLVAVEDLEAGEFSLRMGTLHGVSQPYYRGYLKVLIS
jgi:hypothetical protein